MSIPVQWGALSFVWKGNVVCCILLWFLICFGKARLGVSHGQNRVSHRGETDSLIVVRQTGMIRGSRQGGLRLARLCRRKIASQRNPTKRNAHNIIAQTYTKKGVPFGTPYKRLAATYFSTNKCSIIGDVRLLPGSGSVLPTIASLAIHYSLVFGSYHSSLFADIGTIMTHIPLFCGSAFLSAITQ